MRLWMLASVSWLSWFAFHAANTHSDPFPYDYQAYLPFCAPVDDIIRAESDQGALSLFERERRRAAGLQSEPAFCGAGPPRILNEFASEAERRTNEELRSRSAQCRAEHAAHQAANRERALARHAACIATHDQPETISAAKEALRQAQWQWTGDVLLLAAFALAVPFVILIVAALGHRLAAWVIAGFRGTS
jgi:hypothetical protein